MAELLLLVELSFSSNSFFFHDMMRLGFQREVDNELGWQMLMWGCCTHVANQLIYLDSIINELELCSNNIAVAQTVMEVRFGDDVLVGDSIMYLVTARNYEAGKFRNLHSLLAASEAHLCRRRWFVGRFDGL
ncbi:hypothetical protein CTI12_AA194790 [Artemisia annua]|uniref:Uncharacterized protein n=1 Tax=Artemisia annua TaxID=35608 RepID=A0A2U1MCH9_ARTAN|nr:hypothetical protein CTI12_AA194790 [Artemisia annua]